MEFRLIYEGPLKAASRSNRRVPEKHVIRACFHEQLKVLWEQEPVSPLKDILNSPQPTLDLRHPVEDFIFVPLVTSKAELYAEIDITILRPGPLGEIITQSGDIDNRLKTLFDALRFPKTNDELPNSAVPTEDQTPYFYCLLEDDNLIHKLSISVDSLLKPVDKNDVFLMLTVRIKGITARLDFLSLIT